MVELFLHASCNNRCINCVGSPDNTEHNSLDYYKSIATELNQSEIISIGGGEPTIHKQFFDIMAYVKSFRKEVLLLTNARAFSNKDFLQSFDALGFDKRLLRIATAIYGPDKRVHDLMSRTPGSFEQTVKGIKSLLRQGYNVEIRVIITKFNYKCLKETADFISKELKGIERVVFISMKLTWEAYKNRNALIVPYKDVVKGLIPAVDLLVKNKFTVKLFHFPHCILPEKYMQYSNGRTVDDEQLYFMEKCKKCKYFKDCSGIWKSYYDAKGEGEFGLKNV